MDEGSSDGGCGGGDHARFGGVCVVASWVAPWPRGSCGVLETIVVWIDYLGPIARAIGASDGHARAKRTVMPLGGTPPYENAWLRALLLLSNLIFRGTQLCRIGSRCGATGTSKCAKRTQDLALLNNLPG
jgi:hypothetical protein